MKKQIVRLTEQALHNIIKESVKKTIQEQINYERGIQFINEGMVMPYQIERVWVHKQYDDCFVVKGGDGEYYDVYPSHHDSYKVENQGDEQIQKIGRKVEQAFSNHGFRAMCHNYDGCLVIDVDYNSGYDGEYDEPLKAWLERNGFTFDHFDEMYKSYWYKFNEMNTEPTEEFMARLKSEYKDITGLIRPYIGRGGTEFGRNLESIYKQALTGR